MKQSESVEILLDDQLLQLVSIPHHLFELCTANPEMAMRVIGEGVVSALVNWKTDDHGLDVAVAGQVHYRETDLRVWHDNWLRSPQDICSDERLGQVLVSIKDEVSDCWARRFVPGYDEANPQ